MKRLGALALLFALDAHAERLPVIVPDPDNLQYLAFWVAQGAGYFRDEGVEVVPVIPVAPQATTQWVVDGRAEVAVLAPPMYLELIDRRVPIVLVANLLQNDPINLVVRRNVAAARKLTPSLPLGERLRGLHGLKVGVAPNPPARLRALWRSQGLDADRDIEMVILRGPEQNAAFAAGRVDALYAHTPYLEQAILDEDGVLLVNQSAGEARPLAARQIHALAVTRALWETRPRTVEALVRAVARAEALVHARPAAAADALCAAFPKMDRRHVMKIVEIYRPAIPPTPAVSKAGFAAALAFFPTNRPVPDLSAVDLGRYVAPEPAERAARGNLPQRP